MLPQKQNYSHTNDSNRGVHLTPGQEAMAEGLGAAVLGDGAEHAHPIVSSGEGRLPLESLGTQEEALPQPGPGAVITPQFDDGATRRLESDSSGPDLNLSQLEQQFPDQRKDPL